MSFDADSLYALLPAIHRARDLELAQAMGTDTGPLRQLVGLLAEPLVAIDENLDQLYDDQFIETCAAWVIPYIGDLVDYQPIRSAQGSVVVRADVANSIRWRRAKGTVRAIEGVLRDVAQRDIVVAEYFQRLSATANVNFVRPGTGTASLRDPRPFLDPGGPFDAVPHSVQARTAAVGGRWNIPTIIAFLWPWGAAERGAADPVPVDAQRFALHPLGIDTPLVNRPAAQAAPPSGADAVPVRLRCRDAVGPGSRVQASIAVKVGGTPVDFALSDLADAGADPDAAAWTNMPTSGVAIDPERGRLAFAATPAAPVSVDIVYPAVGVLGGGAYERAAGFDAVSDNGVPDPVRVIGAGETLAGVLGAAGFAGGGIVEVPGNVRLDAAGLPTTIAVAAGQTLVIRAADLCWPTMLLGTTLELTGGAGAQLVLDGFLIEGAGIAIPDTVGGSANGLDRVTLRHCTLVPGLGLTRAGKPTAPGAASLVNASADTVLVLDRCITGPVRAVAGSQVRISDSILDAGDPAAPAIAGPTDPGPCGTLWIYNSTVRGAVRATTLALASNTMFLGVATIAETQSGIVRFSYLADGFVGPRRYTCVDSASAPVFRSWQPGSVDYARLSASAPAALLEGADDGGEIGAWHGARESLIADGMRVRLGEYTRFGLDSGVRHATGA